MRARVGVASRLRQSGARLARDQRQQQVHGVRVYARVAGDEIGRAQALECVGVARRAKGAGHVRAQAGERTEPRVPRVVFRETLGRVRCRRRQQQLERVRQEQDVNVVGIDQQVPQEGVPAAKCDQIATGSAARAPAATTRHRRSCIEIGRTGGGGGRSMCRRRRRW